MKSLPQVKLHALIPCAGIGSRFGSQIPKQYQMIKNQQVLQYVLNTFLSLPEIQTIFIGISEKLTDLSYLSHPKIQLSMTGGLTRAHTVLNTLNHMLSNGVDREDWVLVHDAARPGISQNLIQNLIKLVMDGQACGGILALPVADTLKKSLHDQNEIMQTIPRDDLWQAQTPQMFRVGQLKDALLDGIEKKLQITDEASAMELAGFSPLLIRGSMENIKITYPEDLMMMEKILQPAPNIRIGQGYDVHRLEFGRDLILGGVKIPNEKGLLGHSDADALLHAITDAMIGAAGLGDIGRHFPDTDPAFKNADSAHLLLKTYTLLKGQGYELMNIDSTIICQAPKLSKYISEMISRISEILQVSPSIVNIKAKTNEGLGYLGTGEAIEAQACVLISR
jgi:2-C-methyl-D-erythritol 2,4-cyclodiphosphate synthase/2-C-methyl-D-erythritol 4-phosphate cytidylyltransferase